MPANAFVPQEWHTILRLLEEGNPDAAAQLLVDRDRRFEDVISNADYDPVLKQGASTIAHTLNYGYIDKIGRQVFLSVEVKATAAGPGAQTIALYLPPDLPAPALTSGNLLAGIFYVKPVATGAYHSGIAFVNVDNVFGFINTATTQIGQNPAVTLANNDVVGMCIRYPTARLL